MDVFLASVPRSLASCEATHHWSGQQPDGPLLELKVGKVTKKDRRKERGTNREGKRERIKKVTKNGRKINGDRSITLV